MDTLVAKPAFTDVFREHAAFVWRSLRAFGVDAADLDDATQEVFVVVHKRHGSWDGQRPREWLFSIAQRVASNHRRRSRTRRNATETREADVADSRTPSFEHRETLEQLSAALAELDEDKRLVFVLYEVEQMPMAEVASVVGAPLKTAYARLYAARDYVAKRLGLEEG